MIDLHRLIDEHAVVGAQLAVQELANDGLLDLDRPVRDVLPGFRLADEDAAGVVTPRQLLAHTAGFEGDLFFDTGTGDDALERFAEVVRGKSFTTVLRERLAVPLGLEAETHVVPGSRTADGHLSREPVTDWGLGWMLHEVAGTVVAGHDGGNTGFASFLRVVPETGLAVALLTNGGAAGGVFDLVFAELSGLPAPTP
ncbi:serine hydrolase domain-containing protein [Lentzea sp. NPDC059081]|uniref:serine hydrolase domain-containing protein n=1 Tax=Lentzea sp. NPDC059081 TaxID=3346719 RepID=UPI003680AACF